MIKRCPICRSTSIESTCIGSLTPGHNPNTHTCRACDSKWRQDGDSLVLHRIRGRNTK